MNNTSTSDTQWLRALTLTERIPLMRADMRAATHGRNGKSEQAHQRLQRWRSQTPFTADKIFVQRMEIDGLTEEDFLHLLSQPAESLGDQLPTPPAWVRELQGIFSGGDSEKLLEQSFLSVEESAGQEGLGFLIVIKPLIDAALLRLRHGIQSLQQHYSALPFNPDTVEQLFFTNLVQTLIWRLTRTMVLELNVARLKGELEGESSEERYHSFLTRLGSLEVARGILQEYPVLTRQLKICTDHWSSYILEFLTHLCQDWQTILETLSPEQDPGQLSEVAVGAGDTHRQGRSVIIATFTSGFRIVYKPHSLGVDVHFADLLNWLNERGAHPPFRTTKIIERGAYGWVEFISARGCETPEELDRFYQRQGGYLALLYALEATDFHFENLIASGEHPVLIDLEALFHARDITNHSGTSVDLVHSVMGHSVLRIGLLPQKIWGDEVSDGIDMSGMGGATGQITPYSVLQPEGEGTDQMKFVRKRIEMPGSNNRPNLNGAEVNAADYVEAITKGFTAIYQLILKHREELLAEGGPLDAFAEDEVRTVLRPTRMYAMLLYESYHPNLLRDALDRDRLLDKLWVNIEQSQHMARVIPSELRDLNVGDIPLFNTQPGSRHLWSSRNEEITDYFIEPSLNTVRRRMENLSEDDLSRQVWFTRAALTTLTMGIGQDQWSQYQPEPSSLKADREHLIAAACKVADRLEVLAQRDADTAMWIGVSLVQERNWTLLPVGNDLYDGTSGIALFLGYLGSMTGEPRYTNLARAALTATKRQLEVILEEPKLVGRIGGFSGWGSKLYTLAHLGRLWNEPELFEEAEDLVRRLSELIETDETLDIIGGAAGCIAALLSLYQCTSSQNARAMAIKCAERLLARVEPMSCGAAWRTDNAEADAPLAGFSHGVAGIAWALMEVFALTGDARYRKAAIDAISYERSLFVPQAANWLDIRELKGMDKADLTKQRFMVAWCHGAVGVGLGRLRSLGHFDDAEVRQEIRIALQTTLERGFGLNHSLCHGDLGNLDLFLQASRLLDDPQLARQTYEIAASILDSINKYGWLCGVPMGVETPGLMTGLAGIGYGLLRLAEPERVPSILTLAPPPTDD
ncbi:MAG: type 2 lanthipeptide synthetase LanM [Pyrinomonadaceae bacterium]